MRFWIFLSFALIVAGCATSSRMSFLQVPPAAKQDTVNVKAYEEKYGKYNGVFLFIENTIEHAGNKSNIIGATWSYYYVIHRKYIVLNPDQESLTTFSLNTAKPKNIGNLFLQMTTPDGQVQRWSQKDLEKTKDPDGYMHYKFIYPRVVKGTIIEEGYELLYNADSQRPPVAHNIPLQYAMPCERIDFRYAYPEWWDMNIKHIADSVLPLYTTVHDSAHSKTILKATLHNVPALLHEAYAPYFKEVAQYLEFIVMKLDMGAYHLNRPATWQEYVKQYQSYLLDRDGFLSSRVSDTTKQLLKGIIHPRQKLSTIISYLQNAITPLQDHEDRDFADVLKQRKGNEYIINGLAYSMLKKANLDPSYLLIHSAKEGYFDSSYVSFDQLYIPAVSVTLEGKQCTAFPYRKDLILGQIQQDYQDQPAIALKDDGSYTLLRVSQGDAVKNRETEEYEITISEDGGTTVKETRIFEGMMAYMMRELLNEVKFENQEKFFKKMFTYEEENTKFVSHTVEHQKEYQEPLRMVAEYTIDNLVTMASEEVLFRTAGLLSPVTIKDFRVEDEDRNNPIDISFDEDIIKDVKIHFPEAWKLKTAIHDDSLDNKFGSLRSSAEQQQSVLHIHQYRHLKKNTAPKEQINELVALTVRKKDSVAPTIIFSKNGK
jgi:hypothetical protein